MTVYLLVFVLIAPGMADTRAVNADRIFFATLKECNDAMIALKPRREWPSWVKSAACEEHTFTINLTNHAYPVDAHRG